MRKSALLFCALSLSARRAWIEIFPLNYFANRGPIVALRKESVDRNFDAVQIVIVVVVALRKESVDRNDNGNPVALSDLVALRKESVDRNLIISRP